MLKNFYISDIKPKTAAKKPGLGQGISKLMFHSILIYSSIYLKINYSRNNK